MFTPLEEEQIRDLNALIAKPVAIVLHRGGHKTDELFSDCCNTLARLVPAIHISVERGDPDEPPVMVLADRLRWRALPSGNELPPFLAALKAIGGHGGNSSASALEAELSETRLPASLVLYIAPACNHCPRAVQRLVPLALIDGRLQLTLVDATVFPELAAADGIQSVPTLVLDGSFRWTGSIPLDEVIEVINTRKPESLGAASLATLLKAGQAQDLAAMMLQAENIFPAFYELLTHHQWSLRLGAMVVLETIAAENRALAAEMLHPLWKYFEKAPVPVKGDILYMFGEIGSPLAGGWLQSILAADLDPEIKESAQEALEKILQSGPYKKTPPQ